MVLRLSQLEASVVTPVLDHPGRAREGVTLGETVPSRISNSPRGTGLLSQRRGDRAGPWGLDQATTEGCSIESHWSSSLLLIKAQTLDANLQEIKKLPRMILRGDVRDSCLVEKGTLQVMVRHEPILNLT